MFLPHRTPALLLAACTAGGLLLADGAPLAGQVCAEGEISHVFIDNHSVFDPEEMPDSGSLRWIYETANRLHATTRRGFIARELLFEPGECYDPLLLEESERLLRNYDFIAQVDVFGVRQPDGSWHVVVDTRDEWTTKLNVNVALEEGLEFRGVSATEENLMGMGFLAGVFFRVREEEEDLGARLHTPRIFGTRMDVSLEAGSTRSGSFFEQELYYPFVGEVGRLAFREYFLHRDELFRYVPAADEEYDHVLLPLTEQRLEVTAAGRLGRPGNLTVFGIGVSDESVDFPRFPALVRLTRGDDFDRTERATEEVTDALRPQTVHSGATRVNLLFGQRNVHFVQRRGLDALRGVQDVQVGLDVGLTVGRSIGGSTTGSGELEDVYTRARLFAGAAPGPVTATFAGSVEGRSVITGDSGWRDVIAEVDGLLYWQPGALGSHTLFARVAASGGWSMTVPFQLTLGGPEGVRGYDREAFPGGRRLLLSVEDRIYVPWPLPELVDVGLTLFADAGRMWSGDAPFGIDSGWKAAAGGGLRIGFPAGTRGVVRVDAAWPLESGVGVGDVSFRVTLVDLIGLAGGLDDGQLRRSRKVNVGPDLFTRRPGR